MEYYFDPTENKVMTAYQVKFLFDLRYRLVLGIWFSWVPLWLTKQNLKTLPLPGFQSLQKAFYLCASKNAS